jgi:hypothetical protein
MTEIWAYASVTEICKKVSTGKHFLLTFVCFSVCGNVMLLHNKLCFSAKLKFTFAHWKVTELCHQYAIK